jgi:hypothetical protein
MAGETRLVNAKGSLVMKVKVKTCLWLLALFFLVWNRGLAQMSNLQQEGQEGLYPSPEAPATSPPKWRQKLQREVATKPAWDEVDDDAKRFAEQEAEAAAAAKRVAAVNAPKAVAVASPSRSPAWGVLAGTNAAYLLAGAALVVGVAVVIYVRRHHTRRVASHGPLVLGLNPQQAVAGVVLPRNRQVPPQRPSRRAA